jgi:hypothetical protein
MTLLQCMRTIDEIPEQRLDRALSEIFPAKKSIGKFLAIMEILKNHYKGDNKKSELSQELFTF